MADNVFDDANSSSNNERSDDLPMRNKNIPVRSTRSASLVCRISRALSNASSTDNCNTSNDVRQYDRPYKVVLLGESGSGKSCLFRRITQDFYDDYLPMTCGVDVRWHTVMVDDVKVKMELYDTAGQDKYRAMTRQYYRDVDAAIFVYDVMSRNALEGVTSWLNELQSETTNHNVINLLVGNKADLPHCRSMPAKTSKQAAEKFAKAHDMQFTEVSAKTGDSVELLMKDIAAKLAQVPPQAETKKKEVEDEIIFLRRRMSQASLLSASASWNAPVQPATDSTSIEKKKKKKGKKCCVVQ